MAILLDPNMAYFLLVAGFVMAILAIFAPGTGALEVGAIFALILAGYSAYNLPTNSWALVLLILGVFPFIFAMRRFKSWIFLLFALSALIVGSVFLFRGEEGGLAVDPILAIIVSLFSGGGLWFIGVKAVQAFNQLPAHSLEGLIGSIGEALTEITHEGTVYAAGEEWSAWSETPIPAGSRVKVIARRGLMLQVQKIEES
jgi:membrane-bound serine protease (ClpP class)